MARPECASTSTKYQYRQLHELDSAMATMRKFGIPEVSDAYQQLYQLKGKLIAQVGFKAPRPTSLIAKLAGLSLGVIKVWHDAESGWMAEARATPKAHPVYKSVPDELAIAILKRELTPGQEEFLMTPDPYIGE